VAFKKADHENQRPSMFYRLFRLEDQKLNGRLIDAEKA
jgi:hypothetical protein